MSEGQLSLDAVTVGGGKVSEGAVELGRLEMDQEMLDRPVARLPLRR